MREKNLEAAWMLPGCCLDDTFLVVDTGLVIIFFVDITGFKTRPIASENAVRKIFISKLATKQLKYESRLKTE